MRYILELKYKGTHYAGWQIQPNALTVQEVLEDALAVLLREKIRVSGSGRTDSGVHARQQFAHFDTMSSPDHTFLSKLNGILPDDIVVSRLFRPAREDFHARFDAIKRAYEYYIVRKKSPFDLETALNFAIPLDINAMKAAAAVLPEYEDFASFSKLHGGNKTTLCRIFSSGWEERGDYLIYHVEANRFLRGMVRALVGTQLLIGRGKMSMHGFRQLISAKDRQQAGPNAAPQGLYLTKVEYPENEMKVMLEN